MSFELCIEPAARASETTIYASIHKGQWYHLQKVLSWISSGLLIESSRLAAVRTKNSKAFTSPAIRQHLPPCPSTSSPARSSHSRVSTHRRCWRRRLSWHSRVLTSWPAFQSHLHNSSSSISGLQILMGSQSLSRSRQPLQRSATRTWPHQRLQSFTRIYPTAILRPSKLGQDRTRRERRSTR